MRTVRLTMHAPRRAATDVYRTLSDFGRYPELSDAVRSVDVLHVSADRAVSRWEVTFRAGLLRWTEEDHFDPAASTIRFEQIDGDIAAFDGSWRCTDLDAGTRIVFVANLDMGIPSLADALEPIAARTLAENTVSIVRGLLGAVEVTDVELAAPAGSLS
jgi:ribosome-associated toxin RatA of RatAB toxin-antitoxin module